jgi:hypothetical protein
MTMIEIELTPLYGCCGYGPEERCECWCHDPNEGGNNFHIDDMKRPEVQALAERIARRYS